MTNCFRFPAVRCAILPALLAATALATAPRVAAAPGAAANTKISVEDGAGKVLFVLKPSAKGYDVEDGAGKKIGQAKVESDRVKVGDAAGKPAFKVKKKGEGFKLFKEPAAAGGPDQELAELEPSGADFKVKDATGAELYKGKPKESKTKVSGPGVAWDVKQKADGVEVESAGARVLRIKGLKSAPAAVFLASPKFGVLDKAAVAAFSARIGP